MILTDIHLVYSGGGTDATSLGGPPSAMPVTNLFGGLSEEQSRYGFVDYRCFYVFNNHASESYRNLNVWIESEKSGGSYVDIGLHLVDEVQTISFSGQPEAGGYFTINVPGYPGGPLLRVDYDPDHPDVNRLAESLQDQIRSTPGLTFCTVSVTGSVPDGLTFTVVFTGGAAGRRAVELMQIVTDGLGPGVTDLTVARQIRGSPINRIAPVVGIATIAPVGVPFDHPLRGGPKDLGVLRPTEGFPVWVRRITPKNSLKKILDDFQLRLSGTFP